MAAAAPPVLLGLRDAAMVGPCRGGGEPPGWATNKLGGRAVRGGACRGGALPREGSPGRGPVPPRR